MTDTYDNIPIDVMINTSHVNKFSGNWAWYNSQFKLYNVTPKRLLKAISLGYAFHPPCNGGRKKSNFKEAWHIALDFDSCDELSSLDEITKRDSLGFLFGSFAYSTPSSTPEKPKSRLVFVFDEPIRDMERYEDLYRGLLLHYPQADAACKDLTRLFFGSKDCESVGIWSFMPGKVVDYLVKEYHDSLPPKSDEDSHFMYVESDKNDYSKYIEASIKNIEADLKQADLSGGKHEALLKAGFALGQFVGATWCNLSESDALNVVVRVAGSWSNTKKSRGEFERVARDAIRAGMGEPRDKPKRKLLKPRGMR